MTLRRRFAFAVALQTALLLILLAGLLFVVLQRFLVVGEEQRLGEALSFIDLDELAHHEEEESRSGTSAPTLRAGFPNDVHVRVVQGGRVLAVTADFPPLPIDLPTGSSRRDQHQLLVRSVRSEDALIEVQLAVDLQGVRGPLAAYLRALAFTVPVMMLVAALVASATAGRLLAPVHTLERSARSVAEGGSERLRSTIPGADAPHELGSLARTLQDAFHRLADSLDREREFTRAAAHDLRSPLTALRARIQATLARPRSVETYRAELHEIDHDVVRMTRLAEHLLLLARDERALQLAPVDLSELAGRSVDRARSAHPEVDIDVDGPPAAAIRGDATLLTHLLDNLLDNAVRHGRGSPVSVLVAAGPAGTTLAVRDRGPGVAPDTLGHLGQAFYRPDAARSRGGRVSAWPSCGAWPRSTAPRYRQPTRSRAASKS